ncbi:MAG: ABC transporter permease [Candidatus Geothermarchaeales archaeon]
MVSLRVYILTRVLLTIPMIIILLTIVFLVLRVMPGDPVFTIVGMHAPQHLVDSMRAELGLDKPLFLQYIDYLYNILIRGNFGNSIIWGRRPVIVEIWEHFPATVELTTTGTIISVVVGLFTGTYSATKRNRLVDHSLRLYGIVIYALFIPWFGMMLQMALGVYLKWLPVYGRIDPYMAPETITGLFVLDSILTLNLPSLLNSIAHLMLPSITLGLVLSGVFTRLTRTNMLEVLRQDFVTAARARGLPERLVVYRHALKNAFIPILTMIGLQFALLLAGAILTESTFSWPGMGRYLIERIYYRDFPSVQGIVVFYAMLVAAISIVVDVIYSYIDPRIRY